MLEAGDRDMGLAWTGCRAGMTRLVWVVRAKHCADIGYDVVLLICFTLLLFTDYTTATGVIERLSPGVS